MDSNGRFGNYYFQPVAWKQAILPALCLLASLLFGEFSLPGRSPRQLAIELVAVWAVTTLIYFGSLVITMLDISMLTPVLFRPRPGNLMARVTATSVFIWRLCLLTISETTSLGYVAADVFQSSERSRQMHSLVPFLFVFCLFVHIGMGRSNLAACLRGGVSKRPERAGPGRAGI